MSFVCSKRDAASRCRLKAAGGSSHANGRVIETAQAAVVLPTVLVDGCGPAVGQRQVGDVVVHEAGNDLLGIERGVFLRCVERFSVLEVIRLGQRREGSGSRRVFG